MRRTIVPAAALCAALLTAAACAGGKGAGGGPRGLFSAQHAVKIAYLGKTHVIKGWFESKGKSFAVRAESDVGLPLFTVTWSGGKLAIEPSSPLAAGKLPFAIRAIAVDIWRIAVPLEDGDLVRYNAHNEPDLEDERVVLKAHGGGITIKQFLKGEEVTAEAAYFLSRAAGPNPLHGADRIVFRNNTAGYDLTIVQHAQ